MKRIKIFNLSLFLFFSLFSLFPTFSLSRPPPSPPPILLQTLTHTPTDSPLLTYQLLSLSPSFVPSLFIDERLARKKRGREGVVMGGSLIDLEKTRELWGEEPGKYPSSFLGEYKSEITNENKNRELFAICPTNFGWQKGAFLVKGTTVFGLGGQRIEERSKKKEGLEGLLWERGVGWRGWERWAVPPSADQDSIFLDMPLLVREKKKRDLGEILSHPRFLGDLRNVFDFAEGKGPTLPPLFWVLIRKVFDFSASDAKAIFYGTRNVVLPLYPALTSLEFEKLQELFTIANLTCMKLSTISPSSPSIIIYTPLLFSRVPLFLIGIREDGGMSIFVFNGRQRKFPGVTLEEGAELLKKHGIVSGGVGSAGGDVILLYENYIQKKEREGRWEGEGWEGAKIKNFPSNKGGGERRVPSLLVFDSGNTQNHLQQKYV